MTTKTATHTPGSWEFECIENDPSKPGKMPKWQLWHHEDYDTTGMVGTGIVSSSTSYFAYVYGREPDVRLIAAAPELLEACEALNQADKDHFIVMDIGETPKKIALAKALALVIDAISKARGES